MKSLTLCADDFGLVAASDRVMLDLAERGRLSAVSCIVNTPGWAAAAPALQGSGLACGLHLNLTEGRPLSPALAAVWPVLPALPRLILQAHLRALPRAALRAELRAQLDAFEQRRGQPPSHIDGHQHVHHLPIMRGLLLELLAERPSVVVRNTSDVHGPGFVLKRALIAGTGGRTLGRRLAALGVRQNTQLFGVYDFGDSPDYRTLMRHWLTALPEHGGLLFCHPGASGDGDAIGPARAREATYFRSAAFADDLAAAGVQLTRKRPDPVDGKGQQHAA